MAYFDVHGSIVHPNHPPGDWQLLFQRGELVFPEEEGGERQGGVRFIWLTANGKLSSRPCRIDSIHDIVTLLTLALDRGWAEVDGGIHNVSRQPVTITIGEKTWTLPGDRPKVPTIDVVLNGTKVTVPAGPEPYLVVLNGVTIDLNADGAIDREAAE